MPQFAANLSMLYNDVDFLDRFAAAAADGFRGVEYLFPYAWPAEQLAGLGASRIMTTRADDAALVAGLREWFSRHP